jgi:hypothetical protein
MDSCREPGQPSRGRRDETIGTAPRLTNPPARATRRLTLYLTTAFLCTCLAACESRPLQIASIQLGRSLNPDRSVAKFTTVFAPDDTIYLSVLTTGGGSGTLSVRWMYGEKVLGEPKKRVADQDLAATDFPLQSAAGFPPGEYSVEVFLEGKSVGTKTFRVEPSR